jgi:hypothetical protein
MDVTSVEGTAWMGGIKDSSWRKKCRSGADARRSQREMNQMRKIELRMMIAMLIACHIVLMASGLEYGA